MPRKLIGHVANTFGLKGALKVILFTDCPEVRFKPGETIEISGKNRLVKESRIKPGMRTAIVSLEGFDDIDEALPLIHQDVYADVEAIPGTIFIDELIGRSVENTKGEVVGTVEDVSKLNTKDYLIVALADKTSRYMPFIGGVFCLSPRLTPGKIVLTPLGEEALR